MPTRTPLSEAERAQRREADREFVQRAVEQLRSSDGWQRWLATRRHFRAYSLLVWGADCRNGGVERRCRRRHLGTYGVEAVRMTVRLKLVPSICTP